MVLLIDNHDSFVYNLARYFEELGIEAEVIRNDAVTVEQLVGRLAGQSAGRRPRAIVISPGPCGPFEAGISVELVKAVLGRVPLLGVCLGHQVLGAATGARIIRAPRPVHGQVSRIEHDSGGSDGAGLFAGLQTPLTATRYHSLIVDPETLDSAWRVTARTEPDLVMAIEHREHVAFGVQFHPESVLTDSGHRLLWNFLIAAGIVEGQMPLFPDPAAVLYGHRSAGSSGGSPGGATGVGGVGVAGEVMGGDLGERVFPDPADPSPGVLHW